MKILFTGGGTGGHFYPIIAVAEEINRIAREEKLVDLEMFFMAPEPYNQGELFNQNIVYKKTYAGKVRRYFSLMNLVDLVKTGWGIVHATWNVFLLYPDVVFGKGGYGSFPAILAARILRIPIVIHESDSAPGKVNAWAGKFADKVAVSYPDAAASFPAGKVAVTGNPVRRDIATPLTANAHEFLNLDPTIPTIFVIGGSLGARVLNEAVLEALPRLIDSYQIVHQTGERNIAEVKKIAAAIIGEKPHKDRYRPMPYLDPLQLRSAAGAANLVVSRAGSTIFEIASWGVPSIIVPILNSNADHQTKNAFAYARSGAADVIEEPNLTGNILVAEVGRILGDPTKVEKMKAAARAFYKGDAAQVIAQALLSFALKHEART
jgi:UDP-N-acetylglucosamine--N-acetylmuramyl-(pentapeptide) pyrophosphoryl-undecaprenol N-acetylglucosamine transferase